MQPFMDLIISDNQCAFIRHRLISDNILLAHEIMHYLKTKQRTKSHDMEIKLDMSKAFDRLEWPFVIASLNRMGFHPHFTELILQCINSVSYSILIGGQPHGFFKPTRGLRQGDPLSLFLFVIAMEGFNQLLTHECNNGSLRGVQISRHSSPISFLFFVEDVLIFCKAVVHQATILQSILNRFASFSGQQVNTSKSALYFSKHCPEHLRLSISSLLSISKIGFDENKACFDFWWSAKPAPSWIQKSRATLHGDGEVSSAVVSSSTQVSAGKWVQEQFSTLMALPGSHVRLSSLYVDRFNTLFGPCKL
ncbi:hypothetical protein Cni_G28831 [Canna indica]|uniref:Reverse transcriptase domain-containing protein n=1 Tax=Canna indica TaxID=4628 RepID=A0AAQ3L3Q2_9LILI|nr:hypothetical protein Cni_G28831 [Canna indica]